MMYVTGDTVSCSRSSIVDESGSAEMRPKNIDGKACCDHPDKHPHTNIDGGHDPMQEEPDADSEGDQECFDE
jgi:hypothetical protein